MSYVTYFRKWIVSYVTYLENDYVVCDIIRVTATDVSDKRFLRDIGRFLDDFIGFCGDFG